MPAHDRDPRAPPTGLATTLRRLTVALAGASPRSDDPEYRAWLALRSPTPRELDQQRARAFDLRWQPLVDVVVRRRPGDEEALQSTRHALSSQTWRRFVLHEARGSAGLAGALAGCSGELALVLDAGDALAPHGLYSAVAAADPETDLVYFDEDRQVGGRREQPYFKPRWSPDELASHPYVGRAAVVRRGLLAEAVGAEAPASPDHGWMLRLLPELRRVRHVPDVLLHRREDDPPEERLPAAVAVPAQPARVAAIVPTRDRAPLLAALLASLAAHPNRAALELIVVDDGSRDEDARALLGQLRQRPDCRVMTWDRPFNWSAVNNAASRQTAAEYLLFLNNDVEATHAGWLDAMVDLARRPGIALVGAQLLYPDGTLQHYGVVVGMTGFAGHLLQGCRPEAPTRCGPTDVVRNCSSVTGACMLVRREVFERLGRFDERFVLCGSDVALGLRARALGLRNAVTPRARLLHHESRTRGPTIPASDFRVSLQVYEPWLRDGDPYYNPNLSLRDTRARIRLAREDMLAVATRIAR